MDLNNAESYQLSMIASHLKEVPRKLFLEALNRDIVNRDFNVADNVLRCLHIKVSLLIAVIAKFVNKAFTQSSLFLHCNYYNKLIRVL